MNLSRLSVATALMLAVCVPACSTYDTLDSLQYGRNGLDQTDGHYGQPYYLPKTIIRLTVKPVKASSGSNAAAAAANVNTNTNNSTGGTMTVNVNGVETKPPAPAPGGQVQQPTLPGGAAAAAPAPGGNSGNPRASKPVEGGNGSEEAAAPGSIQYAITVTTETVPDYESGVLYLKQNANWFYSEETKISVNDKNLLATADTTSSDRTAQVIYNLADAAANIAKFTLASSERSKSGDDGATTGVRYRLLNIDVRFDPFNDADRRRVEALFSDTETSPKGIRYISPLAIHFRWPGGAKAPTTRAKFPIQKSGIFFRDPMALEIEVHGREKEMLQAANREAPGIKASLRSVKASAEQAQKELEAKQKEISDVNTKIKDVGVPGDDQAKKAKLAELRQQLAHLEEEQKPLSKNATDQQTQQTRLEDAHKGIENVREELLAKSEHRTETLAVPVLDKRRVFAYDIARSAFVQGKKHNLTIVDGTLRGITKTKPSEAEGFSEIPLRLTEKLLAFPKDLLTFRQEVSSKTAESLKAKTNAVNEETNLVKAQDAQALQAETARLQAEKAKLDAQIQLLQKQRELNSASP